jgi:hypothetical protein
MTGKTAELMWATFVLNFSLYCAGDRVIKSRRMRWTGHVARMWERRGVYSVLVGNPQGNRTLGSSRHRWEDNIKMEFQELSCGGMVWTRWSCVRIGTGGGQL